MEKERIKLSINRDTLFNSTKKSISRTEMDFTFIKNLKY